MIVKQFNTYSRYGRVDPTLGPEPLTMGHEFHNLSSGLKGQHNHAFSFSQIFIGAEKIF